MSAGKVSLMLAWAIGSCFGEAGKRSSKEVVVDFLEYHCYDCHDSGRQKADLNFERLNFPLTTVQDLEVARRILHQVGLQEMPPKKKEQPGEKERLELIQALRGAVTAARSRFPVAGGRTVMRRLSNREYEKTLEVLFGRQVDTLGLTADFPKEKTSHHIDTIGETLVTSGFLVDQYFQSAQRLVEFRLGKPEIEERTWHFKGNFKQYEELSGSHKRAFQYKYLCIYEQPDTDTRQGSYGHIEDFLEGVPVSGLYELEVLVQGMHRDTHYDPKIFGIDLSEPFIMGVVPGDATKGHIHYPQRIEPLLARSVVPDKKPEWIKLKVWLEAGQTPRFIFPNGPFESRASVITVNKRYEGEFKKPQSGVNRDTILLEGKLPHIRISEVKVRGPLAGEGGSAEERAVFGEDGFQAGRALAQLEKFAARAYRRPLNEVDRKRLSGLYEKRTGEGAKPRQAALDVVKLILCSPSFFYLSEITPEGQVALKSFDLAARLSYALWGGPPDRELLELAAGNELDDPAVLRKQVLRMIADPRIEGFVESFLDGWLGLRDLGSMPPPRANARFYYAQNLPNSMKEEARQFFRHLLQGNGQVMDLLAADYTFVDKYLAQLYKLPEAETLRLKDGFQKVVFKNKSQRGGVLGMAAVLAVSSNGVETSPVTRGVFVSENLLGVIPPDPPADVPAIDPDVRGATSRRDRLARHLAAASCAECHRKIDPPGFGLEVFDELGRWRVNYARRDKKAPNLKVDASGVMPSGEAFEGFEGLREILLTTRADVFKRHLISTVLTHATGRHMGAVDQFVIEDIQTRFEADGGGLGTLLVEALTSGIFRSR